MKKLYGVVCATVTPMRPNGEIDIASTKSLFRYLVQTGIHCFYPNGTNGESISLSKNERRTLANIAVEETNGKLPIYIQCGATSPLESYQNVQIAKDVGADGAGLMTPVFFPMDELAMEQYYARILDEESAFPIYIYNIPGRTGNDILPRTLGRLMDTYPTLQGIKYSSSDLSRINAYIHCSKKRRADVLIGCDSLAWCCIAAGGVGWVSGPCAVFPEIFTRLYRQILDRDIDGAGKTHEVMYKLGQEMSQIPEIPAIKYMLKKRGIIQYDTVRPPLRNLNALEQKRLDALMSDLLNI